MKRLSQIAAVGAMVSYFLLTAPIQVQAASSSVGVSITFAVAPADLYLDRNIEPATVRTCESLKARVETEWRAKNRKPIVRCASRSSMPLIVTDESGDALVVRP